MSMSLTFEPHSWYMGAAIKKNGNDDCEYQFDGTEEDGDIITEWYLCTVHGELAIGDVAPCAGWERHSWSAYLEDGMVTYSVIDFEADTLRQLKQQIKDWHQKRAERDRENRRQIKEKK